MSKGPTFCNDLLQLIFNGVGIDGLAVNDGSPLTDLYVALHFSDPIVLPDPTQITAECSYTGYARQAVARTTSGWTVTGNSVSPNADIVFPIATGGSETATNFSVGTASSGIGKILHSGALNPPVVIETGVTPGLTTTSFMTET